MSIQYRRDLWQAIKVRGDAAELGVAEGLFSADMLSWPDAFKTLHMVDRWQCVPTQKGDGGHPQHWHDKNLAEAYARVQKHGDRARFVILDTVEAAKTIKDKTLSLLYIDADHSFQGVMADLNAWVPKVMKGGVVALHDYEATQYGVKKAVTEYCQDRYEIHLLPEDKPCDAGAYFYV